MALVSKSPNRHFKTNSPFNYEQAGWVVEKCAGLESLTVVRRAFRFKFSPRKPAAIPHLNAFQRLVERFRMVAATRPCVRSGRQLMTPGEMEQVRDFFRKNATVHARQACEEFKMSIEKVLKILILSWPPSIEVQRSRAEVPSALARIQSRPILPGFLVLDPSFESRGRIGAGNNQRTEKGRGGLRQNINEEQMRKMVRHTQRRAEPCVAERRCYFEHFL